MTTSPQSCIRCEKCACGQAVTSLPLPGATGTHGRCLNQLERPGPTKRPAWHFVQNQSCLPLVSSLFSKACPEVLSSALTFDRRAGQRGRTAGFGLVVAADEFARTCCMTTSILLRNMVAMLVWRLTRSTTATESACSAAPFFAESSARGLPSH